MNVISINSCLSLTCFDMSFLSTAKIAPIPSSWIRKQKTFFETIFLFHFLFLFQFWNRVFELNENRVLFFRPLLVVSSLFLNRDKVKVKLARKKGAVCEGYVLVLSAGLFSSECFDLVKVHFTKVILISVKRLSLWGVVLIKHFRRSVLCLVETAFIKKEKRCTEILIAYLWVSKKVEIHVCIRVWFSVKAQFMFMRDRR